MEENGKMLHCHTGLKILVVIREQWIIKDLKYFTVMQSRRVWFLLIIEMAETVDDFCSRSSDWIELFCFM